MKYVLIVLLLLAAGLMTGVVVVRLAGAGDETNWFNESLRAQVAEYPALRQVLGLVDPGDARSDYLGSRYDNITIIVSNSDAVILHSSMLQEFADKVSQVTNKKVTVYRTDSVDPVGPVVTGATLNLKVMAEDPAEPTSIGSTDGPYSIIIYEQALERFAEGSLSTLPNYQLSTAMHEFGHLLGLSHNSLPGCLMNANAETDHRPRWDAKDVVINFCPVELDMIQAQIK